MGAWAYGGPQFVSAAVACLLLVVVSSLATGAPRRFQKPRSDIPRDEGRKAVVRVLDSRVPPARFRHVRAADPWAAALMEDGERRSETFRRLVQALNQSDLFVYVEAGYLNVHGHLQFAAATPGGRYVHITINAVPEFENEHVAWLGHELQHAVEIAGAREVTSTAALQEFYASFAQRTSSRAWCTPGAQKVRRLVLAELSAGRR